MIVGYSIPEVRKALIASLGAVVSICHAFGVPIADDVSTEAVAIFDAAVAFLVFVVPNSSPE